MKKLFIYILLSAILVTPIVSIITISFLSQPESNVQSYKASYDYNDLEVKKVIISDIEEVITCKGSFDSSILEYQRYKYRYTDNIIMVAKIDNIVKGGDVLFIKNEEEIVSDFSGKVVDILDNNRILTFIIKSFQVDHIKVYLPLYTYELIENSKVSFSIGHNKYSTEFREKFPVYDSMKKGYCATYSVNNENLIIDGEVVVNIFTGLKEKDVFIVPKQCIFQDEYKKYFLKAVTEDQTFSVYVEIGILGEYDVQIYSNELYDNMSVLLNQNNVFTDSYEASVNKRKLNVDKYD